jgi:SAM-dependent methyltransferase
MEGFMDGLIIVAVGIAGLLLAAAALWWLLIGTEGVYLGRRVVIGLYDLYARRYDRIKQYDPDHERTFLARPILDHIPHVRAPLVLDVATGTGRLPLVLLEQPTFQGRIVALDLSRKMLTIAADRLKGYDSRVSLMHHPAESLPFPDDTFDLVTCIEALEFMAHPWAVLHELVRVLRPDGLLVITNRQGLYARLMPGKVVSHDRLQQILRDDLGMRRVALFSWQVEYRLVIALKPGESTPAGPRLLAEIWQCPGCGAAELAPVEQGWRCLACDTFVPVGKDGVIETEKIAKL